jgi:hypothetical protein
LRKQQDREDKLAGSGATLRLHEQKYMTPILDPKKMISHPGNKPYWIKENWSKGALLMQRINNSY